jgi:hypothetical protein
MLTFLLALAALSDVRVSAETIIRSDDSIVLLAVEATGGLLHGGRDPESGMESVSELVPPTVLVDGLPSDLAHALWRVAGFVIRDRGGSVEYAYGFDIGRTHVSRWAQISNGMVRTSVTLTGDLGDRRLQSVTLTLEANDGPMGGTTMGRTTIRVALAADVATGNLGARLGHPIIRCIAQRQLTAKLRDLEAAGRSAVEAGRGRIDGIIARLLRQHQ